MGRVKNIGNALISIASDSNIQDVAAALGDSAIDTTEIMTTIPILGPLLDLARATSSVSDNILAHKIQTFLNCIDEIPQKKREDAIRAIKLEEKYRQRVGTQLLLILDKCDDEIKAEIVAWLFTYYITYKCDYDLFLHACHTVQDVYIGDIDKFIKQGEFFASRAVTEGNLNNLANSGLFTRHNTSMGMFVVTDIGHFILDALKGRKVTR